MAKPKPKSLPFQEAIDFFKDKVRLPTEKWTDLREGMHARGFVVAGVARDDILADIQAAVMDGLENGSTLADFRKTFAAKILPKWTPPQDVGWRTRVIFETNIRMSYAAGRFKQAEELKATRPYLRYVAVMDGRTRPEHLAWNDTVLPIDDPWWKTHFPPQGFNCRCTVQSLSAEEVKRLGLEVAEEAPPVEMETKTVAGRGAVEVPKGIDPGFAYNVGEAAWGKQLAEDTMAAWRAQGASAYERLTPGDAASAGRPKELPADKPRAKRGPPARTKDELIARTKAAIGGDAADIASPDGGAVHVDAETLASHLSGDRAEFLPFLRETIEDPGEVWLAFERHKGTGKVELRKRFVKSIELGGRDRYMIAVAQATRGQLEAWTLVPTTQAGYAQRQRVGQFVFGRKD